MSFEPPYVMNNFWPPLPSFGNTTIETDGKKLGAMFSNINLQEIQEMMKDCGYNEVSLSTITYTQNSLSIPLSFFIILNLFMIALNTKKG